MGAPHTQYIKGGTVTGGQSFTGNVHGNVYYGSGHTSGNATSRPASTGASPPPKATTPDPPRTPTNVLIMSSDPRDEARLRLATERRELEDALRGTRYRESFTLRDIGSCRIRDITRALDDYKPRILHFSGHGSRAGIFFEKDNGEAVSVKKEALGALLGSQEGLELVVLNACYSQDEAQTIADAVGCVVGMEGAILDEDAIDFSREFYRALGDGRAYDEAFRRAKLAVGLTSNLQPHLLKRIDDERGKRSSSKALHFPRAEELRGDGAQQGALPSASASAAEESQTKPSVTWSADSCSSYIEISHDGLGARYDGPRSSRPGAVLASRHFDQSIAFNPNAGDVFQYFEVEIISTGPQGRVAIGISEFKVDLDKFPGSDRGRWIAYHGNDGRTFEKGKEQDPEQWEPEFGAGDVVGCGILGSLGVSKDSKDSEYEGRLGYWTKNGRKLGWFMTGGLNEHALYPAVGMTEAGTQVKANFGAAPFRYDPPTRLEPEMFRRSSCTVQ